MLSIGKGGLEPLTAGSGTTTINADTQPSALSHHPPITRTNVLGPYS